MEVYAIAERGGMGARRRGAKRRGAALFAGTVSAMGARGDGGHRGNRSPCIGRRRTRRFGRRGVTAEPVNKVFDREYFEGQRFAAAATAADSTPGDLCTATPVACHLPLSGGECRQSMFVVVNIAHWRTLCCGRCSCCSRLDALPGLAATRQDSCAALRPSGYIHSLHLLYVSLLTIFVENHIINI